LCLSNDAALVQAEAKGLGWFRAGTKVAYYQRAKQYTLTFTVTFPYDSDRCYMAHCFPYTYSDLQVFLSELCSDPAKQSILCRRDLCQSLAGNSVDLLTITQVMNQLDPRAHAHGDSLPFGCAGHACRNGNYDAVVFDWRIKGLIPDYACKSKSWPETLKPYTLNPKTCRRVSQGVRRTRNLRYSSPQGYILAKRRQAG
jgi:hypothetical protein